MDFQCISFHPMWVPDRSVWVSDSQQPFVEHQRMSPDVLYMKKKQALVIPCRVTHPNITTTLVKVSAGKTPEIQRRHLLIFYFWFRSQLSIFAHFFLSVFHPLFLCVLPPVPLLFFSLSRTPSSCFSLSGSFATLFLSWQPLHGGVCVHLFVSVGGYVWKCVRMCLWVLVLECWVKGYGNWNWGQRGAFTVPAVCAHMCVFVWVLVAV